MGMKSAGLSIVALLIGARLAYVLFAISFNSPLFESPADLLEPLGLALAGSGALGFIGNVRWRRLALLLALPTVAMCVAILVLLAFEDRWGWTWILLPAVVVLLCLGAAWAGSSLHRPGRARAD